MTALDEYRVTSTHGWRYEFPNGHTAWVINNPSRPFRFSLRSTAPDAAGGVADCLTSEQVEAELHEIAALTTNPKAT